MHRPKRCEYNKKDEDNSPNTLNDEISEMKHQASSLKFRQVIILLLNNNDDTLNKTNNANHDGNKLFK